MWYGFEPDDFFAFEQTDIYFRIEYIKNHLHPRLRALGDQIRKYFLENNIHLRHQLRSGRWYKMPIWTHVSLIALEEERRSDPKRPRLSVYIDEKRVIAGFCHTLWRPEWKKVCKDEPALIEVIDSTARSGELQIGILHRTERGVGEIFAFSKASDALAATAQAKQDFLFVGSLYPWPDQQQLLCSPSFLPSAQKAMISAWPIYEYAFYIAPVLL
ncbi:MAG: hypothetical protein ACE5PV_25470 [Candidatus Poribacteria bacterium]